MFTGNSPQQMDDKNRLAIPARFRDQFDATAYLTVGEDGCLAVYTRSAYDARGAAVMEKPADTREGREERRAFFANTAEVKTDAQGRLTLPAFLVKHAGLNKDVIAAGTGEYFEFWDAARWEAREAAREAARAAQAVGG